MRKTKTTMKLMERVQVEEFTCSQCAARIWGERGTAVACGDCMSKILVRVGMPTKVREQIDAVRMRSKEEAASERELARMI
jgi:DNA-directed RNA polymerase subunit RPC12/RpoP